MGYLSGAGKTSDLVGFNGLAVDTAGDVYVTGFTFSQDFPRTTATPHAGASDAFLTKIKSDGSAILWSTLLGGADEDRAYGLALDPAGNIYLTGFTLLANFPTLNAFDTTLGGARDSFVAKFNASGNRLWSTYLGGSGEERAIALVPDAAGNNLYVFGDTESLSTRRSGETTTPSSPKSPPMAAASCGPRSSAVQAQKMTCCSVSSIGYTCGTKK